MDKIHLRCFSIWFPASSLPESTRHRVQMMSPRPFSRVGRPNHNIFLTRSECSAYWPSDRVMEKRELTWICSPPVGSEISGLEQRHLPGFGCIWCHWIGFVAIHRAAEILPFYYKLSINSKNLSFLNDKSWGKCRVLAREIRDKSSRGSMLANCPWLSPNLMCTDGGVSK